MAITMFTRDMPLLLMADTLICYMIIGAPRGIGGDADDDDDG